MPSLPFLVWCLACREATLRDEPDVWASICRSVLPFLTVLFGAANSHTQARDALAPYLEMKGVKNIEEQDALVAKHKLMFYQFGWAALILSCIPIIGSFFAFTNTVGAALWAIDLEKEHFNLMSDDRKKLS